MQNNLLDILVCPVCQGKLEYRQQAQQLRCRFDQLDFPIRQGIPVMLIDEATPMPDEDE